MICNSYESTLHVPARAGTLYPDQSDARDPPIEDKRLGQFASRYLIDHHHIVHTGLPGTGLAVAINIGLAVSPLQAPVLRNSNTMEAQRTSMKSNPGYWRGPQTRSDPRLWNSGYQRQASDHRHS